MAGLLLASCAGDKLSASSSPVVAKVDCGTEQFGFGSGYDAAKRDCLWAAFAAGRPASFTSVHHATEGALLTYTATVINVSRVEVHFENASSDGSAGAFNYSCGALERRVISDQPSKTSFAATNCTGRGPEVLF